MTVSFIYIIYCATIFFNAHMLIILHKKERKLFKMPWVIERRCTVNLFTLTSTLSINRKSRRMTNSWQRKSFTRPFFSFFRWSFDFSRVCRGQSIVKRCYLKSNFIPSCLMYSFNWFYTEIYDSPFLCVEFRKISITLIQKEFAYFAYRVWPDPVPFLLSPFLQTLLYENYTL